MVDMDSEGTRGHGIFAAASVDKVFSKPVEAHGRTVITASEVFVAGGYGGGSGTDDEEQYGQGYGGGGTSNARPVAAIIMEEDGVYIEPIADVSKVLITLITAFFGMLVAWSRVQAASRTEQA